MGKRSRNLTPRWSTVLRLFPTAIHFLTAALPTLNQESPHKQYHHRTFRAKLGEMRPPGLPLSWLRLGFVQMWNRMWNRRVRNNQRYSCFPDEFSNRHTIFVQSTGILRQYRVPSLAPFALKALHRQTTEPLYHCRSI